MPDTRSSKPGSWPTCSTGNSEVCIGHALMPCMITATSGMSIWAVHAMHTSSGVAALRWKALGKHALFQHAKWTLLA